MHAKKFETYVVYIAELSIDRIGITCAHVRENRGNSTSTLLKYKINTGRPLTMTGHSSNER